MVGVAVGAAVSIGGAALSSSAAKKAAKKNSQAIDQASDAQLQATRESNALQAGIYNQNYGILSPYAQQGSIANAYYSALLGLPASYTTMEQSGLPTTATGAGGATQYVNTPNGIYPAGATSGAATDGTGALSTTTTVNPVTAQQAFNTYQNSTGYQFRLNEGADALASKYAGAGLTQSGAAQKALVEYGQNVASQEFSNYMSMLGNQAGMGLSAGSALAGVGTNYANAVSANNQNQANFTGQAAIAQANNSNAYTANMAGALGQGLSGVTSALNFSSYGNGNSGLNFGTPASAFYNYV